MQEARVSSTKSTSRVKAAECHCEREARQPRVKFTVPRSQAVPCCNSHFTHVSTHYFTLFIITAARFSILYFYPSFQLVHVGWVAAAGRGHQVARGSKSNAGKISTLTHYCLGWEALHRCIFHSDLDAKEMCYCQILKLCP